MSSFDPQTKPWSPNEDANGKCLPTVNSKADLIVKGIDKIIDGTAFKVAMNTAGEILLCSVLTGTVMALGYATCGFTYGLGGRSKKKRNTKKKRSNRKY
jgi:hypothetical protein